MKLIIWLWNPWKEYEKIRHNIWFLFLDFFISKNNFSNFKLEKKFKWEISQWSFMWKKTILFKPNTFINLSWESIKLIIDFYNIDIKDIIVIYDDISMDFWKIKFRKTGSSWGHNWIKDIIKYFEKDFNRIKIWIWFDEKYNLSDWVLSKFTDEELNNLQGEVFDNTLSILNKNF